MAKEKIALCNHIKPNGEVCESPSLRQDEFCFFHRSMRERTKRQLRSARQQKPLQIPPLEDAATVQLAIGDVLNALLADRIDHKKAGLLLYGLQTAAANMRACDFKLNDWKRQMVVYSNEHEESLEREIEQEIAQEEREAAQCEAQAEPAAAAAPADQAQAEKPSKLPNKKPASRITQKEFRDTVFAVALQKAEDVQKAALAQLLAEDEDAPPKSKRKKAAAGD